MDDGKGTKEKTALELLKEMKEQMSLLKTKVEEIQQKQPMKRSTQSKKKGTMMTMAVQGIW